MAFPLAGGTFAALRTPPSSDMPPHITLRSSFGAAQASLAQGVPSAAPPPPVLRPPSVPLVHAAPAAASASAGGAGGGYPGSAAAAAGMAMSFPVVGTAQLPVSGGGGGSSTTLQGALPRELAQKFERHRRDAEAHLAARKAAATQAAAQSNLVAQGSADGSTPRTSAYPAGPATSGGTPTNGSGSGSVRPHGSAPPQRTPSRSRGLNLKKGSVILEDLDNKHLLGLQVQPHHEQRSISPFAVGHASGGAGRLDKKRRAADDHALLPPRKGERGGRQMYDKRTLRRLNKEHFRAALQEWCAARSAPCGRPRRSNGCHVSVRMRPMFDKEAQSGEFEVVTAREDWGELVVHNCLFHADLVRMYVHHLGFCFPRVFGPTAANEEVYAECGLPLVAHALCGQLGTLFMFGQTGSGKTYTMSSIMEHAAHEIFQAFGIRDEAAVCLKVFEIAGRKCFDLLPRQRTELKLLDDQSGRTNIVGATEAPVCTTEECLKLVRDAMSRRATAGHARNDESSRSHCVCILDLLAGGQLILVDCAGTERRQDSDQHSSERMRESAEINASLHALKECIRYRCKEQRAAAKGGGAGDGNDDDEQRSIHVPYRDSQLTRVLHESFTRPGSYLAAIGTISPTSMDTEHTVSTLKTLQLLLSESGNHDGPNFEQRIDVDPKAILRDAIKMGQPRPQAKYAALRAGLATPLRTDSALRERRDRTPDRHPRERTLSGCRARSQSAKSHSNSNGQSPNPLPFAHGAVQAATPPEYPASAAVSLPCMGIRRLQQRPGAWEIPSAQSPATPPAHAPLSPGAGAGVPTVTATAVSAKPPLLVENGAPQAIGDSDVTNGDEQLRQEMQRLRSRVAQLEGELKTRSTSVATAASELGDAVARAERAERQVGELTAKSKQLEALFIAEQEQRRKTHNQLLDLKGQIRVFCRIRPALMSHEQGDEIATCRRDAFTAEVSRSYTSVEGSQRHDKRAFQFDAVFGPSAKQEEVFREVQDLVQSAVDGYSVTLLAYGQTGAGKTYTMYGGPGEQRGIAPRTIESIFQVLNALDPERFAVTVRAHLVELYKSDMVDLLAAPTKGAKKLEVRRDTRNNEATIDNVEEREVKTPEQLLRLLEEGAEHRHVASTQMNADSSRSHLLFTTSIESVDRESGSVVTGKVRICDLAGSERPKKSGAQGDVMKEAIEINKALTALGDVIAALTRGGKSGPVPYRNHKLTQLLSDSLGGTAKTLMFVNVSPARSEVEETVNSLTYASRARNIVNNVQGLRNGGGGGSVNMGGKKQSSSSPHSNQQARDAADEVAD